SYHIVGEWCGVNSVCQRRIRLRRSALIDPQAPLLHFERSERNVDRLQGLRLAVFDLRHSAATSPGVRHRSRTNTLSRIPSQEPSKEGQCPRNRCLSTRTVPSSLSVSTCTGTDSL